MIPNFAQLLCQIGIAVGGIIVIFCSFGTYYFGKAANDLEAENIADRQMGMFENADLERQVKFDSLNH